MPLEPRERRELVAQLLEPFLLTDTRFFDVGKEHSRSRPVESDGVVGTAGFDGSPPTAQEPPHVRRP